MLNNESLQQLLSQLESWKEQRSRLLVTVLSPGGDVIIVNKGPLFVNSIVDGQVKMSSDTTVVQFYVEKISQISHVAPEDIPIEHFTEGGPKAKSTWFITFPTMILTILDVVMTTAVENSSEAN